MQARVVKTYTNLWCHSSWPCVPSLQTTKVKDSTATRYCTNA